MFASIKVLTRTAATGVISVLTVILLTAFASVSLAMEPHTIRHKSLILEAPFAFATPPAALSAGGYLKITNNSDKDEVLVGGSATFAGTTEIHEMKMVDDVMKMRKLEDGLVIPAGETVELQPGGLHVMFMQLTESLVEGNPVQGTLDFKEAGSVDIEYQVLDRKKHMKGKKMHKH